ELDVRQRELRGRGGAQAPQLEASFCVHPVRIPGVVGLGRPGKRVKPVPSARGRRETGFSGENGGRSVGREAGVAFGVYRYALAALAKALELHDAVNLGPEREIGTDAHTVPCVE